VILYEMSTGQRPFGGGSASAIAAAILASDPAPVRTLQPNVPPPLERIIVTALEKNPNDRWQTAQDVARQLRWLGESSSTGSSAEQVARTGRALRIAPVLALIALAALAVWAGIHFARRTPAAARSIARLELAAPPGITAVALSDVNAFAISPDGNRICFLGSAGGRRALYLRELSSYDARKIGGSEDASGPFWSPDGEWIGFSAQGKLWKTKRSGDSPPRALCDVAIGGAIGTWHDGIILFSDAPDGRRNIFRVSDQGGAAVPVTQPAAGEWRHTWPYFLPGGRHFVFLVFSSLSTDRDLVVASLDGTRKGVLLKNVSAVRASAVDQLMYVRDGKLLAQRFDASAVTLAGEPVSVADDVAYFYPTAKGEFDAVASGSVVYRTETRRGRLSIVDRGGVERKLVDGERRFFDASLSLDATKAAVTVIDSGTGLGDIWLYDIARGVRDRFTSHPGMEFSPLWSPDGRWLYYSTGQGSAVPNIVRRGIDAADAEQITERGRFRYAESLSPDGTTLYFVDRNPRAKTDIYRLRLAGGKPEALLASEFMEADPEVSPDGKWLAYISDSTGSPEVYLQSLAGSTARIRVSSDGGFTPRWRGDGGELFYVAPGGRISVVRTATGDWKDAKAETLFTASSPIGDYAAFPDGATFLLAQWTPGPRDAVFHMILGWH
jgi:Tol biopolymer transport system component